ncbi:Os12g0617250, partial [Oryza sativa Japonica Group]
GLRGELAGVDEGAVEAVGDARRQLDGGLQPHVGGVHDEELGCARGLVADEGEDVAVVLAARRGRGGAGAAHGHEARLAAEPALAVLELGELAGGEVHLGEAGHLGPRLGDGEVGVFVRLVEDGVGGRHAGSHHHHLAGLGLLPRIPQVEAEAVGDVDPHHLQRARRVLGEHAEPRRLLPVEHHRRAAAEHLAELEHHLVVGYHHEVLGDGEVVDHRRLLKLDLDVG